MPPLDAQMPPESDSSLEQNANRKRVLSHKKKRASALLETPFVVYVARAEGCAGQAYVP